MDSPEIWRGYRSLSELFDFGDFVSLYDCRVICLVSNYERLNWTRWTAYDDS
jgi:hypothetical protein